MALIRQGGGHTLLADNYSRRCSRAPTYKILADPNAKMCLATDVAAGKGPPAAVKKSAETGAPGPSCTRDRRPGAARPGHHAGPPHAREGHGEAEQAGSEGAHWRSRRHRSRRHPRRLTTRLRTLVVRSSPLPEPRLRRGRSTASARWIMATPCPHAHTHGTVGGGGVDDGDVRLRRAPAPGRRRRGGCFFMS